MQIHADMIRVPPNELNATSLPWPFFAWGMDVIGPLEPAASNEHRFIMVAIDYFTKWVEVASYKVVTKKAMVDFVQDCIVCRVRVPESIITDNTTNLNSDLMKAMCETFKIKHRKSTTYRPQMNRAIPFALLGYCTTIRTSTGATPYLLVYVTGAIIPAEVEIPSLRIIQEAEFNDAKWVRSRYEQLALIDGKRMNAPGVTQVTQAGPQDKSKDEARKREHELTFPPQNSQIFFGCRHNEHNRNVRKYIHTTGSLSS
uniref:Uncharacterized protein LOC104239693 n=1 Tax=Nicotiana sylvestris TaxID=4096 RepID=A0A1U7XP74_NICSY|nr:PREDICTED: uncharacterized protein LOC104239693 [Nicotiana sylvestris]